MTALSVPIGVTVNGEDHEFAEPLSVRELLTRLDLPCQGWRWPSTARCSRNRAGTSRSAAAGRSTC